MRSLRDRLPAARLAVGLLTVFPVPGDVRTVQVTVRRAMCLAPLVGAVLGAIAGGVAAGLAAAHDPLVGGVVAIATLAVLSRGLHLDGLADTVDGLGSLRPPAAALEVMARGDLGPFGAAALVVVLVGGAAAIAAIAAVGNPGETVLAVAASAATGRLAATLACTPGVPPARPTGLGALVAGSVGRRPAAAVSVAVLAGAAGVAAGTLGWPGALRAALGVVAGLAVSLGLRGHAVRRLGGVTGDVLGALIEVAGLTSLVVWSVH